MIFLRISTAYRYAHVCTYSSDLISSFEFLIICSRVLNEKLLGLFYDFSYDYYFQEAVKIDRQAISFLICIVDVLAKRNNFVPSCVSFF